VLIVRVGCERVVSEVTLQILELLMRCSGTADKFSVVDIFDAVNGRWSTAALSAARDGIAATSLPNQGLAIFAGGFGL
jgi:hypothetical protein